MVGRGKWVLHGDGYPNGWWGGDGFRYKSIGAGTGKEVIPAAGMRMKIALTDEDGDGNSNTRPAPFASLILINYMWSLFEDQMGIERIPKNKKIIV